jgi:hypothetical protein
MNRELKAEAKRTCKEILKLYKQLQDLQNRKGVMCIEKKKL